MYPNKKYFNKQNLVASYLEKYYVLWLVWYMVIIFGLFSKNLSLNKNIFNLNTVDANNFYMSINYNFWIIKNIFKTLYINDYDVLAG